MPRTIPINDGLGSRRPIRLAARDLVACRAWQTRAAVVPGVWAVRLFAPWFIPMILANPARPTAELAFHALSIFVEIGAVRAL